MPRECNWDTNVLGIATGNDANEVIALGSTYLSTEDIAPHHIRSPLFVPSPPASPRGSPAPSRSASPAPYTPPPFISRLAPSTRLRFAPTRKLPPPSPPPSPALAPTPPIRPIPTIATPDPSHRYATVTRARSTATIAATSGADTTDLGNALDTARHALEQDDYDRTTIGRLVRGAKFLRRLVGA